MTHQLSVGGVGVGVGVGRVYRQRHTVGEDGHQDEPLERSGRKLRKTRPNPAQSVCVYVYVCVCVCVCACVCVGKCIIDFNVL